MPVWSEQLAGSREERRRRGGEKCLGKRPPAIISPCLPLPHKLINETRRVKLSAPAVVVGVGRNEIWLFGIPPGLLAT